MKVHTVVKHVVTFLSLFSGLRLNLLCLFRIAIRVSTPLMSYNCKLLVVPLTVRQLLLLDRMKPKALKMLNSGMQCLYTKMHHIQQLFSWPARMQRLLSAVGLSVGRLSKTTTLSEPKSLNILELSEISCVISLDLKLRPCIPCLQKANTLS